MESQRKSEATKAGIRWRMAEGIYKFTFKYTLGFYRDNFGRVRIEPTEAKIVEYIYDSFLEGASPTKIAVALTEQGMHADGHSLSAVLAHTADLDGTMQCAGNDPGIAGGIVLHLLVDRLGGSKKNALCSR